MLKRNLPPARRAAAPVLKGGGAAPSVDALRGRPKIGEGTERGNSPYFNSDDLRSDWLEVLVAAGERGAGRAGILKDLGITKAQLETLFVTSPAFAEAYERCITAAEAHWDEIGHGLAIGELKGGNATVYVATMVNRFGWNSSRSNNTVQSESKVQVVDASEELKARGINSALLDLLKGSLDEGNEE